MTLQSCFAALFLSAAVLISSPAAADDVVPSARVSSAVLVREGPSTETAILARLRPGDSATLVGEISGWYVVELADGTRGYVSKAWTIIRADRKSTRLNSSTNAHLVCRLLLDKKKTRHQSLPPIPHSTHWNTTHRTLVSPSH